MRKSCDSSMYWCSSSASARADARSCPNGFSTTTRAFVVSSAFGESLHDRGEQERRDLEVEHRAVAPLDRVRHAVVGGGVREVARHVGQPRREAGEDLLRRAPRRCRRSRCAPARRAARRSSRRPRPRRSGSRAVSRSRRYSERKVITFARSPVMPKITKTSQLMRALLCGHRVERSDCCCAGSRDGRTSTLAARAHQTTNHAFIPRG